VHNDNQQYQWKWKPFQEIAAGLLLACGAQASASVTNPAIGQLLWSEEFNGNSVDTATWTAQDGNGCQINLCGYGNAELQYYSPNNASISTVPFESGTRAWPSAPSARPSAATALRRPGSTPRARYRSSTA
jgi:hypothetical protein